MRYILAFAALFCAAAVPGHAQLSVYGAYTTSRLTTANTPRLNGGTFGAFYDGRHFPVVKFGIDIRATILPVNDTTGVKSLTVGPRVVFKFPVIPIHPYGELTAGGDKVQFGSGGTGTYNSGGFAASAIAGIDLHLLPLIDWRVIDYSFTRLAGPHANQSSFSTGIVVHIPFS